jgi:hypothetical protein
MRCSEPRLAPLVSFVLYLLLARNHPSENVSCGWRATASLSHDDACRSPSAAASTQFKERGVRLLREGLKIGNVLSQQPYDILRRAVAETQPDHLWWGASKDAQAVAASTDLSNVQ